MQSIRENWPADFDNLKVVLIFNRKLWTVLVASVTREENPMPAALKQNIANLGLYILNETLEILLNPEAPARLDSLININRQLAMGLRAS